MLYVLKDPTIKYSFAAEIRSVSEDVSKPVDISIRMVENTFYTNNKCCKYSSSKKAIPLFLVFRALGVSY